MAWKIMLVGGIIVAAWIALGVVVGFINDYRDFRDYMRDEDD